MAEYDNEVASQIIDKLKADVEAYRALAFLAYGALSAQNCEGAAEVCKIMRPTLWPDENTNQG